MSWVSKVEAERGEQVFLVRGKDNGRNAWYYVFVEKTKVAQFQKMIQAGSLNLEDYGRILYSGWGQEPPDDIVEQIKKDYSSS